MSQQCVVKVKSERDTLASYAHTPARAADSVYQETEIN